jgi:mono/diheme cytochrome c family protein
MMTFVSTSFALLAAAGMLSASAVLPTKKILPTPWVVKEKVSQRFIRPEDGSSPRVSAARGRNIYRKECRDCHGLHGVSNPRNSSTRKLKVLVPDVTQDALKAMSDGELFYKISKGRDDMPSYRSDLEVNERWDLVGFLRILAPKKRK